VRKGNPLFLFPRRKDNPRTLSFFPPPVIVEGGKRGKVSFPFPFLLSLSKERRRVDDSSERSVPSSQTASRFSACTPSVVHRSSLPLLPPSFFRLLTRREDLVQRGVSFFFPSPSFFSQRRARRCHCAVFLLSSSLLFLPPRASSSRRDC